MKKFQSVVPIAAPSVQRQATGLHLIGDLYGCLCDSRLMLDAAHLESFCKERVAAAGLTTGASRASRHEAWRSSSFAESGSGPRSGAPSIGVVQWRGEHRLGTREVHHDVCRSRGQVNVRRAGRADDIGLESRAAHESCATDLQNFVRMDFR